MIRYTNLPDNKQKIYGGVYSVHDMDMVNRRNELICEFTTVNSDDPGIAEDIKREFVEEYRKWMFRGFNFLNSDLYQYGCFTQGTTESFAHFYLRYRDGYRLRLKRADYFYHQMMKTLWYSEKFAWLEDDDIREGDVVLISVPFSDTGDCPDSLEFLLDACDRQRVPVMLDLAYLNLTAPESFSYSIDLARPCIKYIVTSQSKVFPVENLRIGLRLQKEFYEDQLYVINEPNYNYINLLSAYVGLAMMRDYDNTFMFNRYRSRQLEICRQLDLAPSPCFNLGIDYNHRFPEYNRGGHSNRLCFSRVWDGRATKLPG